jgi:AraC-like DNA-binding protein
LKLFIKNIVSLDSLRFVRSELDRLGLHAVSIETGEITAPEKLTSAQYQQLCRILQEAGIEIFEDKKEMLVQRIKTLIVEVIYQGDEPLTLNLSAYLSEKLERDYTYISNLFSDTQHLTIERFYICHKIERVKELLLYEGLTLTEIAYKMYYSSLAHLSRQFKKITGLTPTQFKEYYSKHDLPPEEC